MVSAGVQDAFMHRFLSFLVRAIYSFHMPLFIALSGALFLYDKTSQLSEFVAKKARRLIIPFFFAMTFVSTPVKYFSGYFSSCHNILADILIGQYLIQGNTHLWFLPTLFIIFIIFFLLKKYLLYVLDNPVFLVLLLIFNIVSLKVPVVFFSDVARYLLWFYTGMCFEKKREAINHRITIKIYLVSVTLWIGLFFLEIFLGWSESGLVKVLKKITEIFTASVGMLSFYEFCFILTGIGIAKRPLIKLIDRDSFGIYLYSDPFNYLTLSMVTSQGLITALSSNDSALVLFVTRFIITILAAVLITLLLRKVKLKYVC